MSHQIPNIVSDPVYSLKQRYYLLDSVVNDVESITFELPVAPFAVSSSTTKLLIPFKAVRLAKIEMWQNYRPEKSITGNTISAIIDTRRQTRPIEWSAVASPVLPAHISKKFNKFDPIGLWYLTTASETNPEITLRVTKGCVFDLSFDFILDDGEAVGSFTTSGLTADRVYTNRIDNYLGVVGKAEVVAMTM